MRKWARAAIVATAVLALGGCANGSPTGPTPVEILSQTFILACGSWAPATPPVTRTLVDARLTGQGDTIAESDLQTLRQNGGEIIHQFAVGRFVRVAIDVDRLLPLHKRGPFSRGDFVAHAVTVADPSAFRSRLSVELDHIPTDADVQAAESLGGRITFRSTRINYYFVEIDDARVPALRALKGVLGLSADGYGCLL